MSYAPPQIYSVPIASGASTASFYLDKGFSKVFVEVPTMSTGAQLSIFGSADGVTFRAVYERVNTAPVQYQQVTIPTTNTDTMVPIEARFPYIQFRASAVVSGGVALKIHCTD